MKTGVIFLLPSGNLVSICFSNGICATKTWRTREALRKIDLVPTEEKTTKSHPFVGQSHHVVLRVGRAAFRGPLQPLRFGLLCVEKRGWLDDIVRSEVAGGGVHHGFREEFAQGLNLLVLGDGDAGDEFAAVNVRHGPVHAAGQQGVAIREPEIPPYYQHKKLHDVQPNSIRPCAAMQHTWHFHFHVWGSNPSQDHFFACFPSPTFLQQPINGEYFSEELCRLINTSCHSESHHKRLPWLGFEPQTWKRGTGCATVCCIAAHARHTVKPLCEGREGKRLMTAYCFTQCSNEYSLSSLLFPRQDNHVQRYFLNWI